MSNITQDYGIKIAQPGYDANTCPDWALLFNSSWPSLAVAFETQIDSTTISSTQEIFGVVVPHNLNFVPLTMAEVSINGASYGRFGGNGLGLDKMNVTVFDLDHTKPVTVDIKCYNIDITQDNSYPLPQPGAIKLPYDSTFGMKVTKSMKDINSTDLRDFVLHTRAQSPALLDIATTGGQYYDPSHSALIYPLRSTYIPWVTAYTSINGVTWQNYNVSNLGYDTTSNSISIGGVDPNLTQASFVIMRDPLFPAANIQVVF